MKKELIIFCTAFTVVLGTVCYFLVDRKDWELTKTRFIAKAQEVENRILAAQLKDYEQLVFQLRQEEYQKGFEAGKTQMGVSFMQGESMLGYSDGYHAAISQFGPVDSAVVKRYLDHNSTTPVNELFLGLYTDALKYKDKEDALFYRDLLLSGLVSDFDEAFTKVPVSSSPTGDLTYEELELLDQLEDDLSEPSLNIPPTNRSEFLNKLEKK